VSRNASRRCDREAAGHAVVNGLEVVLFLDVLHQAAVEVEVAALATEVGRCSSRGRGRASGGDGVDAAHLGRDVDVVTNVRENENCKTQRS
jgi:hypothetical protein